MEKLTCPYSRRCGGCQLLHLTYREELAHKQALAQKYLSRFGRVTRRDIPYNAYRASRNLSGREKYVSEYLFLLEKIR